MAWYTLSAAVRRGISREGWERRITAGAVSSYVDGAGRRMVWVEDENPVVAALADLHGALAELREEIHELRGEVAAVLADRPAEPVRRGPAPPAAPRGRRELLERLDATWEGSDRELERQAGLPQRFLTKARRGERNGPRAAPSWDKLRRYLEGRHARAA